MNSKASKRLGVALACLSVSGCAAIHPNKFAPPNASAPWIPAKGQEPVQPSRETVLLPRQCSDVIETSPQSLVMLSDTALRNSPLTREAWSHALGAAAEHGRAMSDYYPTLSIGAQGGYSHFLFQAPGNPLVLDQWEFQPLATLNYLLLDFGRRSGEAEETFQEVLAANLSFNRTLQDIVFSVQKGYYRLQAARAMVEAAEVNLAQSLKVREAADYRMRSGLATRPEVLLARRVEAKAVYDLENALVLVTDAQADLALTLGLPATCPIPVVTDEAWRLPRNVEASVDALVDVAVSHRPDLGAHLAKVRAREAAVDKARADYWPELSVQGQVGGDFWDYTIADQQPRVKTIEPNYAGMLNLNWDLFLGFERENAVRAAVAYKDQASASLQEAGLLAVAQVWKAYYRVRAARKRFDYAEALLEASADAYASTFDSYKHGLSTIVELLDADKDYASARFLLVDSRVQLLVENATLAYAAGTIYETGTEPTVGGPQGPSRSNSVDPGGE